MEVETHNPEETQAVAAELVARLAARQGIMGTATVVTLSGELGAGKTTFMQGVARALGVDAHITSPTFVIQKTYDLARVPDPSLDQHEATHTDAHEDNAGDDRAGLAFDRMIHIDAYRLESTLELASLGWYEQLTNPKNIIFMEWPEMVASAVPDRAIEVRFEVHDETGRTITITDFS